MEFERLLEIVENEPVFETGLVLSGEKDPFDVHRQLSRWTTAGKILQLRRGLYCLAPPYQKVIPHPFLVANRLRPGSYVSLQSALSFYGLIPERVPGTTSISAHRPESLRTPLGAFDFRHVQIRWLRGYQLVDLGQYQKAFIALPEKALLDLIYLQPGGDSLAYLQELRLQSLEKLDLPQLRFLSNKSGKPKLIRSVETIQQLVVEETGEYQNK
jgi:predicted transcriptional regulator of viral defense system